MTTLSQYVNSLSGSFTQLFNGKNETGVDIGLPYNTPVYALNSGTVVGSGYYGGGGVETIRGAINAPNYSGVADVYYQHLSTDLLTQGQTVQAGQLIGYSGGQLGYGNHPSSAQYSTGPHIEVGINAPYGGIWGTGSGPNVNPVPWLQTLGGAVGQTALLGAQGGYAVGSQPVQAVQAATDVPGAINNAVQTLTSDLTLGLRLGGWLLLAFIIMGAGLWLLIPEQTKQAANGAISGIAKGAAKTAALAA